MDRSFFMFQHAQVHSADVGESPMGNLADVIYGGLDDDVLRSVPAGQANSMIWLLWHMARSEDVAISMMLCGDDQLWDGSWVQRTGVEFADFGTGHSAEEVAQLSESCVIEELCVYRSSVGRRSRELFGHVATADLERVRSSAEVDRLDPVGAVHPSVPWVKDFWSGRPGYFFLWVAVGHSYMHLQEASVIRSLQGTGLGI
jgi:hypothetical protein